MSCSPSNTSGLAVGSRSVTCTATGGNGKSASATKYITVNSPCPTIAGKTLTSCSDLTTIGGGTRYVGSNANNYVSFNGEIFRIIGVFNGQLKIMRNDFYGTELAWDTSGGKNWSSSSLRSWLNSTYLNSLNSTYRNMIDTSHIWYVGENRYDGTKASAYSLSLASTWVGAIGLIDVSDYVYASTDTRGDTDIAGLEDSGTTSVHGYVSNDNWMAKRALGSGVESAEWLINPFNIRTDSALRIYYHRPSWGLSTTLHNFRPSMYLKSSIKITGGTGTSSNPYILSS